MILKNSQFDHDESTLHTAIGIPSETRVRCKERIFFCAFANHLQIEELFEDPEDAPKNMRTASGDLERTLSIINDQTEYEYTLFSFINTHDLAKMAIAYHSFLTDSSNNKSDRLKVKMLAMAAEMKVAEQIKTNSLAEDHSVYSPNELIKRIPFVKKSHYNFDTYMNMIKSLKNSSGNDDDSISGSDFDIDSFLKDILE